MNTQHTVKEMDREKLLCTLKIFNQGEAQQRIISGVAMFLNGSEWDAGSREESSICKLTSEPDRDQGPARGNEDGSEWQQDKVKHPTLSVPISKVSKLLKDLSLGILGQVEKAVLKI